MTMRAFVGFHSRTSRGKREAENEQTYLYCPKQYRTLVLKLW